MIRVTTILHGSTFFSLQSIILNDLKIHSNMKIKIKTFILSFFITCFLGCENDDPEPQIDENGLTKNITDLVPQEIFDEMVRLGMPINGGGNPPNIEGSFLGSPFILVSSNRSDDVAGFQFADYRVTFTDQKNKELTVMVDYENNSSSGSESGSGLGSFIVGENSMFSVFVEVISTHSGGTSAKFIHVISGTIITNGIEDLYFANFMIDDEGDPQSIWIENGEGRVIYDQDGFSSKF